MLNNKEVLERFMIDGKQLIYIASPYTLGNVEENVKISLRAANELFDNGFLAFSPLWIHYCDQLQSRTYEDWTRILDQYIMFCHAVYRLPGESKGADHEVKFAETLGIPVFYNIDDMKKYFNNIYGECKHTGEIKVYSNLYDKGEVENFYCCDCDTVIEMRPGGPGTGTKGTLWEGCSAFMIPKE